MDILGIDIGGSGVKGAPVNIETGKMLAKRHRIPTPLPATPDAVGDVVVELVRHFAWTGPIGCTFPAVVRQGIVYSAANVDQSWIGAHGEDLLAHKTGCPVRLLNDADAAGIAEMALGAGRDRQGVVIIMTFGTGIGTAVFIDGQLVPNTEFGHLQIRGKDAEHRAAARVREAQNLSWKKWAKRVNEFLAHIEVLFSPDLLIFGGGVSKNHAKFFRYLETNAEIVPAQMFNQAGIVGAAIAAQDLGRD